LGDRFPYAERPFPHRLLVFPLHLVDTQPLTAYLRIQTSSTMMVETLNLWQYPGLLAATQMETALYWLVFGLIALGVLSNLVFWFWLRDGIYRSYTVYLVTLLLLNLINSGFAAPWLWPQTPLVADRAIGVMTSVAFFVGLVFFDRVLGLRQSFPRLGRVIPVILAIYAAGALAAAAGHWAEVAPLIQLAALIATIGITVAGPWLLWRSQKHLWLYVLAFSTQLLIIIAALSRNLGLWPLEIRLDHFILSATAIHIVLLNFALAERVRHAQREKLAIEKASARLESEQLVLTQQQEFMSMVAHEFRTPLTIIDTCTQRIAGYPQSDSGKLKERCANIRSAVQRLTTLMDEFLTLDRMEGAVRRYSPSSCRLDEILDAVLAEFPSHRIDIQRQNLPETLVCDPSMLRVALTNLLSNALRFSPPERLVRFVIDGRGEGDLAFHVSDDGPGIPVDEQTRLFEKYFRGRNSQAQPGAGLGLFLVQQVVNLHGGAVSVVSAPDLQTCFTLTIPLPKATRYPVHQAASGNRRI
jgi:signal transduction histidine kinase